MKSYLPIISLTKNGRGIWDFDTSKGCNSGLSITKDGCYGDCYANKTAKRYGYDFSKTVLRYFKDESHRKSIVDNIKKIDMPFIRVGCSGDPSENWQHMINILNKLTDENQLSLFDVNFPRRIVVITRHWTHLTEAQLHQIAKFNLVINTSVSALDESWLINNSLEQYERLKNYCKSVLRVVSCDFNLSNPEGLRRSKMQEVLFKNNDTLDTVFRPSKNSRFVTEGIININRGNFIGKKTVMSKHNKKTYVGRCEKCFEMCGLNSLKQ